MFKLPKFISVANCADNDIIFSIGIGYITEFIRWHGDDQIYETRLALGFNLGLYAVEISLYKKLKTVPPVYQVSKE